MSDLIAASMDQRIEGLKARRARHMRAGNYGMAQDDLARIKRERTRQLKYEVGLAKPRRRARA